MDIEQKDKQNDRKHMEIDEPLEYQDDYSQEEEDRILNAVKNLDVGKKVYHNLIDVD